MASFITTVSVAFHSNSMMFFSYLSSRAPQVLSKGSPLVQSNSMTAMSVMIDVQSFPNPPESAQLLPCSQSGFSSNQRTKNQFRPRNTTKGTTSYQLRQYADATLGGGSLRKMVKLPEGEEENEWLAVNSKACLPLSFVSPSVSAINLGSGRFLQSDQSSLWVNYGVLFSAIMSRDEGNG